MRNTLLFTALFFALLTLSAFSQTTTILTTSGEEFRGVIVQQSSDTIVLQSTSGTEMRIPKSSVRTIYSQKARIQTTSGEEFRGAILHETSDTIVLQSTSGIEMKIARSSVQTIDYVYDNMESNKGFWAFGGAIGTPAGLNLVLERNFTRSWGLSFSLGYLFEIIGLEVDSKWLLGGSGSVRHSLSLGVGAMEIDHRFDPNDEWTYCKGAYNLNWGGFHLDLGLSVGSGTYSNPQLMGQIGYVHQFR